MSGQVCVPILGCGDPLVVSAWAALGLAFVGLVSIGANVALVWVTRRMAKATEAAIDLEKAKIDQRRRELAAAERARLDQIDRDTHVELEITGPSASTYPTGVIAGQARVTIANHGPGLARWLRYGLRSPSGWTASSSRDYVLRVGQPEIQGLWDPPAETKLAELVVWATYTDEVGRTWEYSRLASDAVGRLVQTDLPPSEEDAG